MIKEQPGADNPLMGRVTTACVGALAGLALYLFVDVLEDLIKNQRLYTVLFAMVLGYFAVLLALIGPAGPVRAVFGAALPSVPGALLFGLASLRYEDVGQFLLGSHPLLSLLTILVIGTPFVAAFLKDRHAWRHYPALFDISWTITVRYTASWLFVGVFWAVLTLSDALLQLVGVTVIEDLLDIDAVPYLLSGLVLGLGLAVVHELRDYVSPFLILRLLRLLLPVVLLVVGLFIAALPLRGISNLFGDFSAAATLMAMAIGGITLVTTALDKTNRNAVATPGMRLATQALALLLPVMGGLSLYAIWLRVAQYGWTPDRLAATTGALFILVYAVLYAVSVLLRGDWMERIRRCNEVMALGLILVAGLWLTPILNAEAISTSNQVSRYVDGKVDIKSVAVYEMVREWGTPGRLGADRLYKMAGTPGHEALLARLETAEKARNRSDFERRETNESLAQNQGDLRNLMPVVTDGVELPETAFDGLSRYQMDEWRDACKRDAGEGRPGCVLVLADFSTAQNGTGGLVFLLNAGGRVDALGLSLRSGRLYTTGNVLDEATGRKPVLKAADLRRIQQNGFEIAPSSRKALWLDEVELIPDN